MRRWPPARRAGTRGGCARRGAAPPWARPGPAVCGGGGGGDHVSSGPAQRAGGGLTARARRCSWAGGCDTCKLSLAHTHTPHTNHNLPHTHLIAPQVAQVDEAPVHAAAHTMPRCCAGVHAPRACRCCRRGRRSASCGAMGCPHIQAGRHLQRHAHVPVALLQQRHARAGASVRLAAARRPTHAAAAADAHAGGWHAGRQAAAVAYAAHSWAAAGCRTPPPPPSPPLGRQHRAAASGRTCSAMMSAR